MTRERAIVVGSGMAGLLAARVAADHFAEVLLVNRDLSPAGPEPRRGTPQDRHVHLRDPDLPEGRTTAGRPPRGAHPVVTAQVDTGGIAVPIEGDRTLVTLLARGGDRPPTDEDAFRAFAATLRDPAIHRAVEGLTPLGPVAISRATQNRLRHYERLTPWPDGLVVLGDAVCALNPVYQQGMTTGARGALLLGELLRRRAGRVPHGHGARVPGPTGESERDPLAAWHPAQDLRVSRRGRRAPLRA